MNKRFDKWWSRVKLPWWIFTIHHQESEVLEIAKKAYKLGIEHQKEIEKSKKRYGTFRF